MQAMKFKSVCGGSLLYLSIHFLKLWFSPLEVEMLLLLAVAERRIYHGRMDIAHNREQQWRCLRTTHLPET